MSKQSLNLMTSRFLAFCTLLGALGSGVVACSANDLQITEFMAANTKTLRDQDRAWSDWIEIHNAGSNDVSLAGWCLTDSAEQPAKWRFPATNLAANGYLVVFASGKDRAVPGAELHTSFSLDPDGEYLALVQPDGLTVACEFAPKYPEQFADISYGLYDSGYAYFAKPTPGAANGTGLAEVVGDTKFSQDRGFYDTPFDVTITCETPGATIRYTTNGTSPSATNGIFYTGPITVGATTVLRAAAFKDGCLPSNADTQSYILLDDVIRQSPTGQPPPGWPSSWGSNTRDYGMDPDVVNSPLYRGTIKDDLKTIPSFSIVMNLNDLFNPSTGIYANASQQGIAWERPCSLELIYPDGRKGFQSNAGLRIRGGYSRSTANPKHAFRVFFRQKYGNPKLKFPMFGPTGADSFDGFDIRTFQNYSWSFDGDSRGVFIRDMFSRDTQLAMGQPATRGDYYHLYIDGQYWGLYNTEERPEASYAASYFGDNKEDYDVIKVEAGPYSIVATDGNMLAWTRLYNLCKAGVTNDAVYFRLQGRNPDGTRNPDYENLLDMDNLVDYMLVIEYGGNLDAPISNFLGNNNPNNWYGIRNRTGTDGFRFFAHDSEHTLLNVNENRMGPYPAGNSSVVYSSPQWIWQKLWTNTEFRILAADHIQRHFFNGGVLTPEACTARFLARTNEIDRAVVGESARWGDAKRHPPLTRDNEWLAEVNRIVKTYFPQRSAIALNQLKSKGLYPNVEAPSFNQQGGNIPVGFSLTMTAPAGTIYYTLNGTDPRRLGGVVADSALVYSQPVTLNQSVQVKSRVLVETNWSALNEATFTVIQTFTNLLVTEVMYHPAPEGAIDGDQFEFVELKSASPTSLDLSGVHFTSGIDYTFPLGTVLAPSQFVVLVRNATNFTGRYPGVPIDGVYRGSLANNGEKLALAHAAGTEIVSFSYGTKPPWPAAADGVGFSLAPANPNLNPDPNDPANWRASAHVGGSPGTDDPSVDIPTVFINEILTHTDLPQLDAIELHNPTAKAADISYWYLTDSRTTPAKFRIPAGTVIPAGGYRVFTEADFNPTPGVEPSFRLNSHGEEVYLYSADAGGNLTGYSHGFSYGAAQNGVTFGRYLTSTSEAQYPPQLLNTLRARNSGPRIGPVVINEIHYHPSPADSEFVELKNITGDPVKLYDPAVPTNTWKLNGAGFVFPPGIEAPAHGLLLVVGSDPAAFRSRYGVPAAVPVLGPFAGGLQDNGEQLELVRPDSPDVGTNGVVYVPCIAVDVVRYNDKAPWPTNAAGGGASLERLNAAAYGNDPINWRASFGPPSPGLDNDGNRPPRVNAGMDLALQSTTFPVHADLAGTATDDGLPNPPGRLTTAWSQVSGPGNVTFDNPTQLDTTASFPGVGTYVLRLTASDGELQASAQLTATVQRPPAQATFLPAGSVWKYLDDGSDQGTAWREVGFDDSAWQSGKAQLGYGDKDEATVVGYGPDSNNKYITTYFRRAFQVTNAEAVSALTVTLLRDDGGVVYLNGTEIFRSNMPEGDITSATLASAVVSGADETTTFFEQTVDPALLVEGTNVLAVEIHQQNVASTDISFDLELAGLSSPPNQAPTVAAGDDQIVTLPADAALHGSVTDDGLPMPPGVPAISWSKISGPADVSFADAGRAVTVAVFSEPGTFVLRLTAADGEFATHDDVTITVQGEGLTSWKTKHFTAAELNDPAISGDNADPDGDTFSNLQEYIAGTDPRDGQSYLKVEAMERDGAPGSGVRVRFQAVAGRSYSLLYREAMGSGSWLRLRDVPPPDSSQVVEVPDDSADSQTTRYYRIVTPMQP